MAEQMGCFDATLILGDRQCAVEADVCVFTPEQGRWGGILHRVPAELLSLLHEADEIRLRLDAGHKRPIRPLDIPVLQPPEGADASVPFIGEGTVPW
ncbi:hypothetical protein [Streptomyces sp. NPDC001286]